MKNRRFWTGIGTRAYLFPSIVNQQKEIGKTMALKGWSLVTGGALQSDYNYLEGACFSQLFACRAHVVRPEKYKQFSCPRGKRPMIEYMQDEDFEMAKDYYFKNGIFIPKAFNSMSDVAQQLHARNFFQIMDSKGKVRSEFVAFASPEDRWCNVSGGTRTAVEIARLEGIPTFNLKIKGGYDNLQRFISTLPDVRF